MGGVLVELGPLTEILGDDPMPADTFWERWLASPTVRSFEMGQCSVEDFGNRLVAELELSFTGPELVERFAQWPKGLFGGAEQLVADIIDGIEIGVLSNTNALHWSSQRDHERVRALFDRTFLSYELGLAKPDRDIFDRIVAELDVAPESVVFLDDNQINVDGALAVGIDAALAKGVDQARAALSARGLLSI